MARPEDQIDWNKLSDAHRAILSGVKKQHGSKPRPLLADMAQNPSAWVKYGGKRVVSSLSRSVGKYEVIVLDDDAAQLITRTAHTEPKVVATMTELAVAPHDRLWVEMSYAAMEDVLRAQTPWMKRRPTAEDERIAFVYDNREDCVIVRVVQHVDGDPRHLHEWPIAYLLSNNGEALDPAVFESIGGGNMVAQDLDGIDHPVTKLKNKKKIDEIRQCSTIWGYEPDHPQLKRLFGLCEVMIIPEQWDMLEDMGADAFKMAQHAARELTGLMRRAVAILALLNTTIVQTGERTRPSGRFLGAGAVGKPFLTRTTTVLNIPHRVRKIVDYAHDEIRRGVSAIRHRRHKVVGHFRHLGYEPINGHGWTPCFCPGREPGRFWHKHIREHERGDESLGRVEHDYRIVRAEHD